MKKLVLETLIITFIISALFGIGIVLLDLWDDVSIKILFTTVTIFCASIPGLCCSISYEKSKDKVVPLVGIIVCVISCIYFILLTWELVTFEWDNALAWDFMATCIVAPLSLGHISLLLLVESNDEKVKYFKIGTIILSVILDILILVEIYAEIAINWKVFVVFGILVVLGTIVTPLMNKLDTKPSVKPNNEADKYKKIEQLKALLDSNAITQEEYETEKNKILNS